MYTVVMMLALTAGGDSPAAHHGCAGCYGCHGCYTVSCAGCYGCNGCYDSCHGRRGLFGHHRNRCNGCSSSCHGGGLLSRLFHHRNNCHDSCHGCTGCYGCHGGYSCHGCTGCYGGYSCHGCAGCYGCTGCAGCYGCCGGYDCHGCAGCVGCAGCAGCMGCAGCYGCHGAVVPTEKVPVKPKEKESKEMGAAPAPATIFVQLPAMAKLTVDGTATTQTSAERLFTTPDLPRGRSFAYQFEAEFTQDGKAVTMTREVIVRAGEQTEVEFTAPAATNVAGR
jgi:uncharacterized protein (TIGR03000 family)